MSASGEEPRIPPVPSPSDVGAHTESPAQQGFRVSAQRWSPGTPETPRGPISAVGDSPDNHGLAPIVTPVTRERGTKKGTERPPTFGPCASPAGAWSAPVPIPTGAW